MKEQVPLTVMGHVKIKDDLGNTLLDKKNAVHPQNMARVISRALANESNYFIHRIAFGNGGTDITGANEITYNTPNDGITDGAEYQSRLYNETYTEIIDDSNPNLGGGAGSNPTGDPTDTGVYSSEISPPLSQVEIVCVLNPGEPTGQNNSDNLGPTEADTDFTFDEIGLFTSGAPDSPTAGYQDVDVGNKVASDDTGLLPNTAYNFEVSINGGAPTTITWTTPASGSGTSGEILYSDILATGAGTINNQLDAIVPGTVMEITNDSGTQTFGFLRITSGTDGPTSSVSITDETGSPGWLFGSIVGFAGLETAVPGLSQGVQNAPGAPSTEVERMLTHIIFSPVLKSANRTLTITYTLTVQVAQSV